MKIVPVLFPLLFCLSLQSQSRQYLISSWQEKSGLPQNSVNSIVQTRDGYLWLATFGGLARFDGLRFTIYDTGNTPELEVNRFLKLKEDRQGDLWIFPEAEAGVIRRSEGRFDYFNTDNGLPSRKVYDVLLDRSGAIWFATQKGLGRLDATGMKIYTTAHGLSDNEIRSLFEDAEGSIWIGTGAGLNRWHENRIENFNSLFADLNPAIIHLEKNNSGEGILIETYDRVYCFDGKKLKEMFSAESPSEMGLQITQDKEGGIWYSHLPGLSYWNKGSIQTFSTREGLSGNQIRCTLIDREGNIWVGTEGTGLNRMTESKIRSFGPADGMPGGSVVPICGDGRGGIWIGGNGEGLFHFADGKATRLGGLKEGLSDSNWSLMLDRRGTLWAGTWGGGVFMISPEVNRPLWLNQGLSNPIVCALYEDREGTIWIGTQSGLNRYRNGDITVYNTGNGLVGDDVKFITQDSNGILWIGTTGGLSRMENGRFANYTRENGLSDNYVRAVHEDEEGVVWIGTYGGGLNRLENDSFFHFNTTNGLYDNVVSRIIEDGRGNFWMTCNRGIFRADRNELNDFFLGNTKKYTCYHYGADEGMPSSECNGGGQPAGWRTDDGRIWFPTIRGVACLDPSKRNPIPPLNVLEEVLLDGHPLDAGKRIVLPPGKKRIEFVYTGISFTAADKVRFRYMLEGFDSDWTDAGNSRSASYTNLPHGSYTFRLRAANNEGVWSEKDATISFIVKPFFYQTFWFIGLCILLAGGAVFGFYELRISRLKARERTLKLLVEERTRELSQAYSTIKEKAGELEQANSKLEEVNKELERLSNLDGLTGIANRRYFEQFMENEWRRAVREKWNLGVIMIDVDHFKEYNDLHGHLSGDDCLRKISQALCVVNRAGDLVARYGGEEFVVVMAKTDPEGALHIARAMKERVEKTALPHERSSVAPVVTISLGVACTVPGRDSNYMELVMQADQALYQAKQSGRNCIACF